MLMPPYFWSVPVQYDWREVKKLEGDIRREFRMRKLKHYIEMRRIMKETDAHLNGLSEIVCTDVARMDSRAFPREGVAWRYVETPDLIAKIAQCVRIHDVEWRTMANSQAV
jgi:hypothetical protein